MTVTATDADLPPQTVTLSIVGGADQSEVHADWWTCSPSSRRPTFEAPTDANADNVYEVVVHADDGNGRTTHANDSRNGNSRWSTTATRRTEHPAPGVAITTPARPTTDPRT